MNYTENLSLGLPGYGESADVAALNRNSGILDAYVYNSRQMECEPYDSTKTYMSGDLAIHNEVIYECNTDNTTGSWDDSKWDSTNLAEQIAKAKQSGGGEVTKEASGNPIELTDAANAPIVKCVTEIQGSQDLHGYDKPWVGGAGKNKLPLTVDRIKAENSSRTWTGDSCDVNGVTITILHDEDGNVTGFNANGTSTTTSSFYLINSGSFSFTSDTILNGVTGGSTNTYRLRANGTYIDTGEGATIPANTSITAVDFRINSGSTFSNMKFYPMIRLSTVSDSTFEPYSNICPITGMDEVNVTVADAETDPTVENTYTINLGGTYYSGILDIVRGVFTVTSLMEVFDDTTTVTFGRASYDNWYYNLSSSITVPSSVSPISNQYEGAIVLNDNYNLGIYKLGSGYIRVRTGGTRPADTSAFVADLGTTPLQVLYNLETPIEIDLAPTAIRSLLGDNYISTDAEELSIEYITQDYQPLVDLIQSGTGHTYSTSEQVVGKWIDGSDLYEKTYVDIAGTGSGASNIIVDADIKSNSGNISVKEITGLWSIGDFGYNDATTQSFGEYGVMGQANMTVYGRVTPNGLAACPSNASYGFHAIMTIRYTKSTTTRSLSAPLTSQKAQIETDNTEEVPTEEEKAVNEEENNDER